jgi:flagellar biosynthesis/type III secretory pathway M-ring protein FliF/YscJ
MENNYFALLGNDVKKLWNGLDEGQKFGMLALIVVTIIAATFFLSKAMEPDWVVLYSDLNEVNALTIVENMKKNGYQYKLSEDKKSILVPSNIRDDMRVFVAENDLIKATENGFELLDEMQLGSTDFKNKLTKYTAFQNTDDMPENGRSIIFILNHRDKPCSGYYELSLDKFIDVIDNVSYDPDEVGYWIYE